MKRLIKFERGVVDSLNPKKYILQEEYEGFGIYKEKCPSGYYVSQSWLIANDKVGIICESYNNFCKEELLDMIDNYNEKKKFGVKGFHKTIIERVSYYKAHHGYQEIV